MSLTVQLSYEEKIINALARLPRPRSDNVIQRNTREFEAIRGVLAPLRAELAEAKQRIEELEAEAWERAGVASERLVRVTTAERSLAEAQAEVERLRKALQRIADPSFSIQSGADAGLLKSIAIAALADAATPPAKPTYVCTKCGWVGTKAETGMVGEFCPRCHYMVIAATTETEQAR